MREITILGVMSPADLRIESAFKHKGGFVKAQKMINRLRIFNNLDNDDDNDEYLYNRKFKFEELGQYESLRNRLFKEFFSSKEYVLFEATIDEGALNALAKEDDGLKKILALFNDAFNNKLSFARTPNATNILNLIEISLVKDFSEYRLRGSYHGKRFGI